ncbi:MAG TPA: winged helix DNA-binding protein [Jiangellaceae bacterium]|nr:winged helix DNA-binding protein [Jiangellaceae bacterium]
MRGHSDHTDAPGIAQGLVRLMNAVDDAYTQASRELGLTSQQAQLLCAVIEPAAVSDLADVLHCDRSNVSRLVERAADRGLVARHRGTEADRRVTVVELTNEGHRHAQRFIEILNARLEPLFANWSAARQRAAAELLDTLAETLEKAQVSQRRRAML